MKNKLGEIEFYNGEIEDILYYVSLNFRNEFMIITKNNKKYLVSTNYKNDKNFLEDKFNPIINPFMQVYLIKKDKYYFCNDIKSISIRPIWDLFED